MEISAKTSKYKMKFIIRDIDDLKADSDLIINYGKAIQSIGATMEIFLQGKEIPDFLGFSPFESKSSPKRGEPMRPTYKMAKEVKNEKESQPKEGTCNICNQLKCVCPENLKQVPKEECAYKVCVCNNPDYIVKKKAVFQSNNDSDDNKVIHQTNPKTTSKKA